MNPYLESGYGLGLARLPDHVDCLADAHADGQWAKLVVEGDQHSRLHGRGQRVQEVVALAQDCRLDVEEAGGYWLNRVSDGKANIIRVGETKSDLAKSTSIVEEHYCGLIDLPTKVDGIFSK